MRFKNKIFAWALVGAVLLGTVAMALVVGRADSAKLATKNNQRVAAMQSTLTGITVNTNARLRGVASALQDSRGQKQRMQFAQLASLLSNEQSIAAIGMLLKVPDSQLATFERLHGYKIKSVTGTRVATVRNHFVLDQVFGRSAQSSQIGTDVATDPVRARAIRTAVDTAVPAATPPLKLLPGARGMILYVPVYGKNMSILDFASRRRATVAVLTLGLQSALIGKQLQQSLPPSTAFRISDGKEVLASAGHVTGDATTRTIAFAGRELTVAIQPLSAPAIQPWMVILAVGLLLTLLIGLATWQAARRERYATMLVEERTRELEIASAKVAEDARFFLLTNDLVWATDLTGEIVSFNDAWTDALGWSREELQDKSMVELINADDLPIIIGETENLAAGRTVVGPPVRVQAKDGSWRWLEWSAVGAPEFERIYGSARDITERVELEEELESERAQMHDAQIIAGLGSWSVDVRTNEMYWSDELFELMEMEKIDRQLGVDEWLPVVAEEDRKEAVTVVAELLKKGGEFEFKFRRARPSAGGEDVMMRTRGFAERDRSGAVVRIVGTVADITERLRHEEHLQFIANHDALTGLSNRRDFDSSLALHVANCLRYKPEGALMMIDLDGLKQINDTIGHDAGDAAIKYMADTLRDRLRAVDISGRLGGDEFVVLLPRTTREGALHVAASIVSALESPPPRLAEMGISRLSASIGIVMIEDAPVVASEALTSIADAEMYSIKRTGRGGASMYDPKMPAVTHIHSGKNHAAA